MIQQLLLDKIKKSGYASGFKNVLHKIPCYVLDSVADDLASMFDAFGGRYLEIDEGKRIARSFLRFYVSDTTLPTILPIHERFWIEGIPILEDGIRAGLLYTPTPGPPGKVSARIELWSSRKGEEVRLEAPSLVVADGLPFAIDVWGQENAVKYEGLGREDKITENTHVAHDSIMTWHHMYAFTQMITCSNIDVVEEKIWGPPLATYERQYKQKPSPRRYLRISKPEFTCHNPRIKDDETPGRKLPKHAVRGHFRVLKDNGRWKKPGRYWIRPHWRGDEKLGIIDTPVVVRS